MRKEVFFFLSPVGVWWGGGFEGVECGGMKTVIIFFKQVMF